MRDTQTAWRRDSLHAVGSMLGVVVTLADGDEWHLDRQGLRVGPVSYTHLDVYKRQS